MVAAAIDGGIKMMSVPSEKLRQKADAVLDPLLSQPLRDAVQRLEATVTNQAACAVRVRVGAVT